MRADRERSAGDPARLIHSRDAEPSRETQTGNSAEEP